MLRVCLGEAILMNTHNILFYGELGKIILNYRKTPKISDTRTFAVITLKVEKDGFSLE